MSESRSSSISEQSIPEPCTEEVADAAVIGNELQINVLSNGRVAVNAAPGSRLVANSSRTLDQISFNRDIPHARHIQIKTPVVEITIWPLQQEPHTEGAHNRLGEPNEEHQAPVVDNADHQGTSGLRQNQISPALSEHPKCGTDLDPLEPSGDQSTNVPDNTADQDNGRVSRHDDLLTIVSSEKDQSTDGDQEVEGTENANPTTVEGTENTSPATVEGTERESPVPNGSISDDTNPNVPPQGAAVQDVNADDTRSHGTNGGVVNTELGDVEPRVGVAARLSSSPRASNVPEMSIQTPSLEEREFNEGCGSSEGHSQLPVADLSSSSVGVGEDSEPRMCTRINEMLYVGLVGPIVWKFDKFFVVIVDAVSRRVQLLLTSDPNESDVVSALERWQLEKSRNLPAIKVICTDGSQMFTGLKVQTWCEANRVIHDNTREEAAQANKIVRGFIRKVKKRLNRMSYEGRCPSTAVKDLEEILNHSTDEIAEFNAGQSV